MSADDLTWHKGPPPAIGWYQAQISPMKDGDNDCYRYWDGQRWGFMASSTESSAIASARSNLKSGSEKMFWRHQPRTWPANARTYPRD